MMYPPRKMAPGEHLTAAHYNALLDYVRRITPIQGANVTVDYRLAGAVISGTPGGGRVDRSLKPWTVRFHATEDDTDGKWEIWLPPGCMSVGQTLAAINLAASEVCGHDDDKAGWHLLVLDEDEGDATTETTGSGDSQVTTTARTWEIVAHAKTSAKIYGVDELDAAARRLLYVSARKRLASLQEAQAQTAEQRAKDTWGDEFSQVVARVTVGEMTANGETSGFRRVEQLASAPISVAGRERSNFDLEWYLKVDGETGELSVEKVYCRRIAQSAAGMDLVGPDYVDVTDAESAIYARIETNGAAENVLSVVMDPSNAASGGNFVTWLRLYGMSHNAVAADYRSSSLVNVQVFR